MASELLGPKSWKQPPPAYVRSDADHAEQVRNLSIRRGTFKNY
jgi:hypothetical protein